MAAQETYRIHETTALVLREKSPHKGEHSDIATIKSQPDRLLDLLYKDAERGFRYDTITVKRYALYLAPADARFLEDGEFIGEFARLDNAEKARDALNSYVNPIIKALEAEFGPATYGPPCPYADEHGKTNPYVKLCLGWKGEDTPEIRALLIDNLIANINARRTTGGLILRSEPSFSRSDDYTRIDARLTFEGGIDRTGDREAKGPVFI